MLDGAETLPWRVTDLKQYVYCPRVLYYHACLPKVRPVTYKMGAGIEAGVTAEEQERRRTLRAYGLKQGSRTFNVPVVSVRLGLRGEVDMVIRTEEAGAAESIPVDYKMSSQVGAHVRLQLAAYAVMLEEGEGRPVRRAFVYQLPLRKVEEIKITAAARRSVETALGEMNAILEREQMPEPTRQRAKCVACEFRRFCNDVL